MECQQGENRMSNSKLSLPLAFCMALLAGPSLAGEIWFQSPSGNIFCVGDDDPNQGYVRCDIMEVNTLTFGDSSPSCDLDYGKSFFLDRGGPGIPNCVGDTIANGSAQKLPYGQQIRIGSSITCYSEKTGLECQNETGGRIFLSKNNQMAN